MNIIQFPEPTSAPVVESPEFEAAANQAIDLTGGTR